MCGFQKFHAKINIFNFIFHTLFEIALHAPKYSKNKSDTGYLVTPKLNSYSDSHNPAMST